MTRDDLEAMTKAVLKEHAEAQGIALGALDSKGTMVDKILGEYVAPKEKRPQYENEKLPALGRLSTLSGEPVDAKRYRLTIFATEGDKSDVDIIVNGHNIRVQRNREVIVQEAYVEILRNAVIDTVVQDPDTGVRHQQQMMVYPHTAVPV